MEGEIGAGAEAVRGSVADAVKKAVLAGVGALFLTEEGARRLAREWKLPKELIGYVATQAQGAKAEVVRILGDEIRRFLESEAVRSEFVKALSTLAVEIHAEVRLKDASGRIRPSVKARVRPGRKRRARPAGEGSAGGQP